MLEKQQMPIVVDKIINNVEKVLVGKRKSLLFVLIALFSGGHVLIQDVPGVGKTLLVNALAKSLDMSFSRIQRTPDMLPGDIVGFNVYDIEGNGKYKSGPIMNQMLLVDEINRATAKTQSALLEAMEEQQVTIDGVSLCLPEPFMVLATQNPIESVGTYPLPEAQMDRFLMRVSLGYPDQGQEKKMLDIYQGASYNHELEAVASVQDVLDIKKAALEVKVADSVKEYIINIVEATRSSSLVQLGASPRASLALMRSAQAYAAMQGQDFITPYHVQNLAVSVLAHRLILSGEAKRKNTTKEEVVSGILEKVKVPLW